MRRSKHDAEQTKQQLIHAACEVFYREGVARATLEQIAREAGVTRGALYWHFDNKTDILDALFQQTMPNIQEFQQHLNVQPLSADEYWRFVNRYYLDFFVLLQTDEQVRKFCTLMHLKCELTESNAQVVALLGRYRRIWDEHLQSVITQAVRIGALPDNTDVVQTTWMLRSVLHGGILAYLGDIKHKDSLGCLNTPIPVLTHVLELIERHPLLKPAA